jgi:CHAT domain-containing protein/Tfp pilus assembly protein PilF
MNCSRVSTVVRCGILAWGPCGLIVHAMCGAAHNAAAQDAPAEESLEAQYVEQAKLWPQALQLRSEGKLAEAAAVGEQMLVFERANGGEEAPHFISLVEWLARLYEEAEDWKSAEARRTEALAWLERFRPDKIWQVVDARLAIENVRLLSGLTEDERQRIAQADFANREAVRLHRDGLYAEAVAAAEEAMVIRRDVLGERRPEYATSLNNLAMLYHALGDYGRAASLSTRALELRLELYGEVHPLYGQSLHNLAYAHDSLGEFGRAEALYRQALNVLKQSLGEESSDYARSLNNLATLYDNLGDYEQAEPLYRRSMEVLEATLGDRHPAYANSVANLAGVFDSMGDYSRSEPLHRRALGIRREILGEGHPSYATSLNGLAVMYEAMGDYARAEPLYLQSLEIRRKLGEGLPEYAESLHNLALLYEAVGEFAQAEPLHRQALEVNRKAFGERHPEYGRSLSHLAGVSYSLGENAKAELLFLQALEITKAAFGENHRDYAANLNGLASVRLALGDFSRAEELLRASSEVCKVVAGEFHADYAASINNLAGVYESMGEPDLAEPLYRQALEIVSELVDQAAMGRDERGKLRLAKSRQYYLDCYVSCLLRTKGAAAAYEAVLNWKGATLVKQRAILRTAEDKSSAPLLAELQSVLRQWSRLAAEAPADDAALKQRLDELSDRREQLESELSRRSESFRAATAKVRATDLQQSLPPGTALIDYFEFWYSEPLPDQSGKIGGRRSLVAFVVRADAEIFMIDLQDSTAIAGDIDAWRASYGSTAESKQAASRLRTRLWEPLEGAIGNASVVLISPDGALGRLPFAALPGRVAGTYLIEDVTLALIPAPQLIPELDSPRSDHASSGRDELLLVGGVDYNRRAASAPAAAPTARLTTARDRGTVRETAAGRQWPALSGASSEVAAIAELSRTLSGEDSALVLSGDAATEESFRELAPGRRILHLATHGFFAPKTQVVGFAIDEVQSRRESRLGPRPIVADRSSRELVSSIVLAGANNPPELPQDPAFLAALPEDGILTAEELAFLPLAGVELTVLSACETGLGEEAGGEGLLGIQRAFQIAGVRTTIATLWKVDDEMTQRLMMSFYRNAWEGKQPYLEALRNAQLEILKELRGDGGDLVENEPLRAADAPEDAGRASRGSPYYWAAFTLSGDWR